ncbi:MAG: hypothetical protein AAF270_02670 [Pseudomonadota bacterium]
MMEYRRTDYPQALLRGEFARTCPHCEVFSQMRLQSAPDWDVIFTDRPRRLGIALTCAACELPVFLTSGKLSYSDQRLQVDGNWQPVLPTRQRIDVQLLPVELRDVVGEALGCLADRHFQAFALMANRIARISAEALGSGGKLTLFNAVTAAAQVAEIPSALHRLSRFILFDLDTVDEVPQLSATQANVLSELMRDMLYQVFIRPAKLQGASQRKLPSVS